MRKIFVFIIGEFIMFSAFGVGENVPTSKSYIDSELVDKQDTIERTTGNNQALTNTGTAGEYGIKDIYDSTGSYTEQTDALIDAQTMNTAVQNAINAEFVCISWVDDDPSKDCLLMEIRGKTEHRSPNVFDASQILKASGWTENNGVYSGLIDRLQHLGNMDACTPGPCKGNTQYTLSYKMSIDENSTPPTPVSPRLRIIYTDGTHSQPSGFQLSYPGDKANPVVVSSAGKTVAYIDASYHHNAPIYISDIQLQEGTTVTPYVPYGNVYIPAGE